MNFFEELLNYDPDVAKACSAELDRQRGNIELIASENIVSPAVLLAAGGVLTNKYAEGYPGKRYYGGCQCVDVVEDIARDRAKALFGAEHANVQPHSGANANLAVFFALLQPGDTVMGMNLQQGGHLSHGSPVNISGKYFNVVPYGVDPATGLNYFTLGDSFYKTDESGMPTKEYVDGIEQDPDVVTIDGKYYTTAIARSKEDFSGSSLPKIYGGITSNLRVWRFNLDINLYYQLGGKAYDRGYSNLMQQSLLGDNRTIQNRHIDMANSWTAPGQNTNFAILTTNAKEVGSSTYKENTTAARSTRWLASSDMLEINNITLSYECSKKFCNSIKIHGLKIYASADHLAILNARRGMYTNYSLSNYSSNAAFSKPARTISIGINLAL